MFFNSRKFGRKWYNKAMIICEDRIMRFGTSWHRRKKPIYKEFYVILLRNGNKNEEQIM